MFPSSMGVRCREEWGRFSESVTSAERAAQLAEGGFAFAFQEGALVKALRQGHWVLLDEINLAPSEVSHHMLLSESFICIKKTVLPPGKHLAIGAWPCHAVYG